MVSNSPKVLAGALLLVAALGGCASGPRGFATATLNRTVPVTDAFMSPPPGGPEPIAVLQTVYTNALEQEIVLANDSGVPGQNVLLVRAYGPVGSQRTTLGRLAPDIPTATSIRRELVERFPGVRMDISGLYAQNRYGPFTYATGRSGTGARCLYAVQRIAAEPGVFRRERGAIVWRLRLCDDDTSARDLLLVAYGLTVDGYFLSPSWNPYGDAPAPDPRIGQPGVAILPQQAADPSVVAAAGYGEPRPSADRPPARRRRAAPHRHPPPAPPPDRVVLNQPIPGAAIVPRPQNTDLGEPVVEGSNLPSLVPPPERRLEVPVPGPEASLPPAVAPVAATPASAPFRITPQAGTATAVRVVEIE